MKHNITTTRARLPSETTGYVEWHRAYLAAHKRPWYKDKLNWALIFTTTIIISISTLLLNAAVEEVLKQETATFRTRAR